MFDGLVKTLNLHHAVIPAQAGISINIKELWIPAYAGMTNKMTCYESILFADLVKFHSAILMVRAKNTICIIDGLVKTLNLHHAVIPAQAGIH